MPIRSTLMPAAPALMLLLAMLLASQWRVPFLQQPIPLLPAYAMIYYWALFWPRALPLWFLMPLSLLHDVLYSLPFGASLCQFVLILLACDWLRRRVMLAHYVAVWLLFAPLLLVMFGVLCYWQYWVTGIEMQRWILAYDMPFLISFLCYPLLGLLLNACYQHMRVES